MAPKRTKDARSHKSATGRQRTSHSPIVILALLLLVVAAWVVMAYWPSLSCKAVLFDDYQYLHKNQLVQNPSLASIRRFFGEVLKPSTVQGYYQPLTMTSLMLDCAMGGHVGNLVPFHRTSLILHVMNTVLLAVFVYLLFGRVLPAAAVGLLFGVHPVAVEPIAWVAERKTLLAAFLALSCLILFVRCARKGSWKLYVASMLMYTLALLAKPTAAPLPLLMLLLDYWPLRRLSRKTVLEKMPFFAIGALFAVLIFLSQRATFGVRTPGQYGLGHIALILCHNVVFYLHKIIWPICLSAFYPFPVPFTLKNPMILAGVIGTCILVPALLISLRWTRSLLVGVLFFFVALFPTMGVVGFHDMIAADRHVYLPLVGIMVILAYLLCRLLATATDGSARNVTQVAAIVVIAVVAALQVLATRRYLASWKDTETLHQRMLVLAPHEPILHNSLAVALSAQRKHDEALIHYNEALRHKSSAAKALGLQVGIAAKVHVNLANTLRQLNRLDDAIVHYTEAIRIKPHQPHVHNELGRALAERGKFDEAIAHHTEAIRLTPNYVRAYCYRGIAFAAQSKLDDAAADLRQALRLEPDYVLARKNLGITLFKQGKLDQAIEQFRRALSINARDADAHCDLGVVLVRKGNIDVAIEQFRTALRLNPDLSRAREQLQAALAQKAGSNPQ